MINYPLRIVNERGAWLGVVSIVDANNETICVFPRNKNDPTRAERNARIVLEALAPQAKEEIAKLRAEALKEAPYNDSAALAEKGE